MKRRSREFTPFLLERFMARFDWEVEINLAESGVHPMTVAELGEGSDLMAQVAGTRLGYQPCAGAKELRAAIAATLPGAAPENVLVTTGCAEANFLALSTLLGEGDRVALLTPNYLELEGIAWNLGAAVRTFRLDPERDFALDVESLERAVVPGTAVVGITNPNNPTGAILGPEDSGRILETAERAGAWLFSDEVYAGAERDDGPATPSLYGRSGRVLAFGSLSKAFGLPGLRIGWVVGPPTIIEAMAARHDYTVISAPAVSTILAIHALRPEVRERARRRARRLIAGGHEQLAAWCDRHADLARLVPSRAGAIACIRYARTEPSADLALRLAETESVLVAPGAYFGLDGHLRVNVGAEPGALDEGLTRLARFLRR